MRNNLFVSFLLLFIAVQWTPAGLLAQSGKVAGKVPVKVTDLLKIKSISEVTLNRDGARVAYTVKTIEPDTASKWDYVYVNHIYLSPADGSAPPKQLTVKESSSQPAWSPDGKQLAFVRTVNRKPQIFILPLDGGEPFQCTHFKYGAGTPKWSPDGKAILFSSNIELHDLLKDSSLNPGQEIPKWPYERTGFDRSESLRSTADIKADPDGNVDELRAYLDNDAADKKAKVVTKLNFQDETNVNPDLSFNHFFIQPIGQDAPPQLLTKRLFYNYTNAELTPDGLHLIITGLIDSTEHPDRTDESCIYRANADGSGLQLLLGGKELTFNSARISPSGKLLAFQYDSTRRVTVPHLAFISLDAPTSPTTIPFDRASGNYTWSTDEKYIYFTAQSNGGIPLYRANRLTGKTEALSGYNSGTGSYDLRGNRLVLVRTEISSPFELFSSDAALKDPRRISSFNSDWIADRQLSQPEKHVFLNTLGDTVEYWVMKPVNYTPGKKVPLLLDIHGGPTAMWGPGENSMWQEFQYFAGKGYGVVYCNPRGSGGYGYHFLRANVKDWGAGPTGDVLTALDKTVDEGWADTSKLLVSGGSYAGYLVAWIVGHDHRFKAACAQRGVYDLATFFGEGNAWRLVPIYFGGYPWEPATKAILQRESPITYVDKITTPLIIFHGENDRRTGFVQGEMLYRSLKVLGRPVEYVRHPGGTHELTRSGDNRQRIDQLLRTYEFFERWLAR